MKRLILFIIISTVCFSCSTSKVRPGSIYIYESERRKLILSFINDSICTLTNKFNCEDLNPKFREINIVASYKRIKNTIILKNNVCKNGDCVFPPTINIPVQSSKDCLFLNNESRESKTVFDGRKFQTDYDRYGVVPNIDIDTLFIIEKQIYLVKKTSRGSIGFVLKKVKKGIISDEVF